MPTIRMPDGQAVRFPDDMARDEINSHISSRYPDAFPSTGAQVADAVIGTGSGIADQALGAAELPANLASGARWLADKAGFSQDLINKGAQTAKSIPVLGQVLQGSQAIRNELADPQTAVGRGAKAYRDYKPTTNTGKYGKSLGQFSAGLIGPKAGLLTRAGKYVAAPGLGAEALSQASEGTPIEGYGRAIGGLLGMGGGALALNRSLGERGFRNSLATADDVEKLGTEAFTKAKNAGFYIKGTSMSKMFDDLEDHLFDRNGVNFIPGVETKAAASLNSIIGNIAKGSHGTNPMTLDEANSIIVAIGNKAKQLSFTEKADQRVLYAAKHFLESKLHGLRQKDVYAGQNGALRDGLSALKDAKRYWTKKSKLELLDQMEERAKDTGKAVFTRGGVEHGTRKEFINYLRKDANRRQHLTKDEVEAFRKVERGSHYGNFMRGVGKNIGGGALGAGGGGAMGALFGGLVGGGVPGALVGMVGLPAGAALTRSLAKRSTLKAANSARALIATGKKPKRGYLSNLARVLNANQIFNGNKD
jgi:hypothetical protein